MNSAESGIDFPDLISEEILESGNGNIPNEKKESNDSGLLGHVGDTFHNTGDPQVVLKKENHMHRNMLYLAAAGHTAVEIAAITGYTAVHVRTIMKQEWFQKQLTRMQDESGKNVVEELLQRESLTSVHTLIELRDNTSTPAAVRAAVSSGILDRVFGKPTQRTESINRNINSTVKMSKEEIELEKEKLEQEIIRLRGGCPKKV